MLKRILVILSPVCLATSVRWVPPSPFIGQWTLLPSKSRMPDEMNVQSKGGNTYAFDFGGGVESIVVDGSDQPGRGGTLLSVKADAADTWIVKRKERQPIVAQCDVEALERWEYAHGLLPRVRVRRFHAELGLRLPTHRRRIGLRGRLAEQRCFFLDPRVDERTLVIANKYDGKVSNTEEFALSTDLKTLTMTVHIVGRDKPYVLMVERK